MMEWYVAHSFSEAININCITIRTLIVSPKISMIIKNCKGSAMKLILILFFLQTLSTQITFGEEMKFKLDKAKQNSKGTILLIHGTAAQNIDGQLPDEKIQIFLKGKDPTHYIIQPTYKNLFEKLNELGWDTVRYTRTGVYQDHIDYEEYKKTDLKNIMDQLNSIWKELPKDKPRIIFAWSGGSVHASLLPLEEVSAVILLGALSTKRTDVYRLRFKTPEEIQKFDSELKLLLSQEKNQQKRNELEGPNYPFSRFFDENNLNESWTYYKKYPKLPLLVLHGDRDEEVSLSQAKVWKEKLAKNDITLLIKSQANHAWGKVGNQPDMDDLAIEINKWLSTTKLKI